MSRPGEIEAIDPGAHGIRTSEYAVYRSAEFRNWLGRQGLEVTKMRALREAYQGGEEWTASASG